MKELDINVSLPPEVKVRLDKYIASLEICTRSQLESFNMKVFRKNTTDTIRLSTRVQNGDTFRLQWEAPVLDYLNEEPMDLDILYENEHSLVLNKRQGVVVHPGSGHHHQTLVQGLMYYLKDLRQEFPEDDIRPGLVHRLDKDTSGVLLVAKNIKALDFLSKQFLDHSVQKEYLAIIKGSLPRGMTEVETYIRRNPDNRKKFETHKSQGKIAMTSIKTIKRWNGYSLVHLRPKTGRTHQLRVHLLSLQTPILGDPIYSRQDSKFPEITLMLHAFRLHFTSPFDSKQIAIKASLPEHFIAILKVLNTNFSL